MNENYADPVDRAVVEQERLLEEHLRLARQKPVEPFQCDDEHDAPVNMPMP